MIKMTLAVIANPPDAEHRLKKGLSDTRPVQVDAVVDRSEPGRRSEMDADAANDIVRASIAVGLALALAAAGFALSACPTELSFGAGAPRSDFYNVGYNPWAVAALQALDRSKSPPATLGRRDSADHSAWMGACG